MNLPLRDYSYFESLKPEKDYIIKDVIPVKSLIMVVSPPAQFKSLIIVNMAICISKGKKWLGHRTKPKGVLICDRENNETIVAQRWKQMRRGLRIRKKDVPLYYLPRTEGDLLKQEFINNLSQTIQSKNIKLLIFDTLHRYGDYQENSADDLSRLYTQSLAPLIDSTGVTIIFLHHTTKQGQYRGTGDFKGMCDLVYEIKRTKNSNYFTFNNSKGRMGERDSIKGLFEFSDKYIKISEINGLLPTVANKKEIVLQEILFQFSNSNTILKKSEIEQKLKEIKFNYSESTLKRALKDLVESK